MKHLLTIITMTCCAIPVRANTAERCNILYILADDLGFSDLGCFGGEIDTPVLDSLAAGGVRLTQFYNTGRCCPSRASLLTGQYPHRVGLGHMTTNDLGQPGFEESSPMTHRRLHRLSRRPVIARSFRVSGILGRLIQRHMGLKSSMGRW